MELPDLTRKIEEGIFTPAEGALITAYLDDVIAKKGISLTWAETKYHLISRVVQVMHTTAKIRLDEAKTTHIIKTAGALRTSKYKQNYRRSAISVLKSLAGFLSLRGQNIDPKEIEEILLPGRVWKSKTPDDMLSKEEVLRVIDACRSARDKALISMCYDGGCRPKELCDLNWSDVTFDKNGAFFKTTVKTGKERRIRLTMSLPYLAAWKSAYPGKPTGNNPVFVTLNLMGGKHIRLNKDLFDRVVRLARDRSGVKKLKPGILRPTRITHDIEDGVPMQYVALRSWGSLKSQMIDKYANPSEKYIDQVALETAGIKPEEPRPREKTLDPIQCKNCAAISRPGADYCDGCGQPLTDETRATQTSLIQGIEGKMGNLTPEELNTLRILMAKLT